MSKLAHILSVEIRKPDFTGYKKTDPIAAISEGTLWLGPRPQLEELDPNDRAGPTAILQLIPYVVVRHGSEVVAYVRPSKGNETRLHGKVSVGLGGHVDLADIVHVDSVVDLDATLRDACVRELEEEVSLKVEPSSINWSGLIYRTDGPVDRVHLGVVAEIEASDEMREALRSSDETGELRFTNPSTITADMAEYEIEAWTKAVLHLD